MLPAKLFAALAVVFALCSGIITGMALPPLDLYLHDLAYLVIGPRQLLWFGFLTCAMFSVLYYATARSLGARWNRTLAILHVSSVVLAAILFFVVAASKDALDNGTSERALRQVFITGFVGVLSFLLGCLVFGVNLVWTVVHTLRAHQADS